MTVRLAGVDYGAGPVLTILHGLFGSGGNWASIARLLATHHRVIAFDLRNHGASPWADSMSYAEMAEDVRAALLARGYRRAAMLGHSMGGKAAMVMALGHPDLVERLVVVNIAPATYTVPYLAYVRAMRRLDVAAIERRADADACLAPDVDDAAERAFLLQNLLFDDGAARWRVNLAAIERAMPDLAGFPAFRPDMVYDGPALFIAGGRSDYLRPEHEPEIRRLFPNARIVRIPDSGHLPHVEQRRAFLDHVERFLASP